MSEVLIGNVRGLQGEQGPQGIQGVQGPAGATGPQGPAGPTGETGAAGATGPQGPAGPTGPQGPAGPTGPQGPAGHNGENGSDGVSVRSIYITDEGPTTGGEEYSVTWYDSNFETHEAGNIIAPQGPQGATGSAGVTPNITATASVDSTTGTPAVTVTKTGTDAAPSFAFAFTGLKGEQASGSYVPAEFTTKNYTFTYDSEKTEEQNGQAFVSFLATVISEARSTGPTEGLITISGGSIKVNAYCQSGAQSSSNSYTRIGYTGFYALSNYESIYTIATKASFKYRYVPDAPCISMIAPSPTGFYLAVNNDYQQYGVRRRISATTFDTCFTAFYRFYTGSATGSDYIYDATKQKLAALTTAAGNLTITGKKIALSATFPTVMGILYEQDDVIYKSSSPVDVEKWYATVYSGNLAGGVLIPNYARVSSENTGTLTVKVPTVLNLFP